MKLPAHRKIVAFCGINGCGKSTIISNLMKEEVFDQAIAIEKKRRWNVDVLSRLLPEFESTPSSWTEYDPGVLLRYGYAYDFLRFYEHNIDAINSNRGLVFAERWKHCLLAWNKMVGLNDDSVLSRLVSVLPSADLTIYIRIDPLLATERILRRGAVRVNDSYDVLVRQAEAYDDVFANHSDHVFVFETSNYSSDTNTCRKAIMDLCCS